MIEKEMEDPPICNVRQTSSHTCTSSRGDMLWKTAQSAWQLWTNKSHRCQAQVFIDVTHVTHVTVFLPSLHLSVSFPVFTKRICESHLLSKSLNATWLQLDEPVGSSNPKWTGHDPPQFIAIHVRTRFGDANLRRCIEHRVPFCRFPNNSHILNSAKLGEHSVVIVIMPVHPASDILIRLLTFAFPADQVLQHTSCGSADSIDI